MNAPSESGRASVLIADDDPDILTLVSLHLERAGYEVLTATNGEDALSLAREREPDIAVLDVRMPKLDGYQVTSQLKGDAATAEMPIVLLSASVHESSVATGMRAGADDYLKKPFVPQDLLARIEELSKG